MTQYVPAKPLSAEPSGKCLAGVATFQEFFTEELGLPSLGCYNPDSRLPGGGPSLHRDGRAVDVGHNNSSGQIALVWQLCNQLVASAEILGVQQVIYRGQYWREEGYWYNLSPATDPHWSHAHVEFTPYAAEHNYYQLYQETLGGYDMASIDYDNLAKAVAREIMEYPLKGYDHSDKADLTQPFGKWVTLMQEEMQLARLARQPAPAKASGFAGMGFTTAITEGTWKSEAGTPEAVMDQIGFGGTEVVEPTAAKNLPTDDPGYRAE